MNKTLTRHQVRVLALLRAHGLLLIADETEKRWRRGETYYVDLRIKARGLRRAFEQGNRDAANTRRGAASVRKRWHRVPCELRILSNSRDLEKL
jgi:hypothetical protein